VRCWEVVGRGSGVPITATRARHTASVHSAAHVGASVKDVSSRGRSDSSSDSSWG
jgi:hypothetical protein